MKILTWNLERLKKNKNQLILDKLTEIDADILILTETSSLINPGKTYSFASTTALPNKFDGIGYKDGEHRTIIWAKYEIIATRNTFDSFTSVCVDVKTPMGLLTVYGTIIGVFGGKGARFESDLQGQAADFKRISIDSNFCVAGDFNVTFTRYAYPSIKARKTVADIFKNLSLVNTTASITDNVDHVIFSENFLGKRNIKIETWNHDKRFSDHIGICVKIVDSI